MPESVFNVTAQPDCSVFAPQDGYGADTFLSFVRSRLKVTPDLAQPRLNSAGETVLSFVSSGRFLCSLQPTATNYVRLIQGTLVQVHFRVFILGNADIIEGDRATIEGHRVEVINAQHWGDEQTECDLRYMGR
jgi:hypothetical protein